MTDQIVSVPVIGGIFGTKVRDTRYVPAPYLTRLTEKQLTFLSYISIEGYMHGDCGSGKTTAVLIDAVLNASTFPNQRCVIFQKTYAQMTRPQGVLDTLIAWFKGTDVVYNQREKSFRFLNGSTITIALMARAEDKLKFQGYQFNHIYLDNSEMYSHVELTFLRSMIRSEENTIRLTCRGVGGDWPIINPNLI